MTFAGYTLNYLWPLELFIKVNKHSEIAANEIWQFPLHLNTKAIQSCIREQNK